MKYKALDLPKDGSIYFSATKQIVEKPVRGTLDTVILTETKSHKVIKRVLFHGTWWSVYSLKDQAKCIKGQEITCIARVWKEKNIKNLKKLRRIHKKESVLNGSKKSNQKKV